MGQSLLDGSDASGVAAFDDIFDLFGKYQFFLLYDLTVFDDVDGDVVVDVAENIEVDGVERSLDLDDVFPAHLVALRVLDDCDGAVQLA